jgi:hypothetical protein
MTRKLITLNIEHRAQSFWILGLCPDCVRERRMGDLSRRDHRRARAVGHMRRTGIRPSSPVDLSRQPCYHHQLCSERPSVAGECDREGTS